MSRQQNKDIFNDTLDIIGRGYYSIEKHRISVATYQRKAIDGTKIITQVPIANCDNPGSTVIIVNSTTVDAALANHTSEGKMLALNFASAKNPGGGVANGANAQEESICRATGLYPCLITKPNFYKNNANIGGPFYSGHMIYSPEVPVIKDNDGELVIPTFCSFLTAPAANTHAGDATPAEIEKFMDEMIRKVVHFAYNNGYSTLILGAWGCGVFGNDPVMIAKLFKKHLATVKIDNVVFAIPGTGNISQIFKQTFE